MAPILYFFSGDNMRFTRTLRCVALMAVLALADAATAQTVPFERLPAPQYAGKAAAEILVKRTRIDIDEQWQATSQAYAAIYLHTDEAVRDYSQMSIGFNSFYESVNLEFARVKSPDGKIDTLAADAVQIQSPADENFYQDGRELTFSLPNLRPGATIEFKYTRREIKKIIPKAWFDSFWFNWWEERAAGQGMRVDPIIEASLDIFAPSTMPLHVKPSEKLTAQFWQKKQGAITQWHWQQAQSPEIILQSGMPRSVHLFPMLQVTTLPNWNAVALWADGLFTPHLVTDASITAIAQGIQKNTKTSEDKVKNLFAYMQDKIRYVFAHVGRGGYEPHTTTEIAKNAYGDCKDQSILVVALARSMGLTAYPALVATRGQGLAQLDAPAVNFDHMIVYFPKQNGLEETWMDTTAESSYFPGFSTGIEGQPALIIKPDSQALINIPTRAAAKHQAALLLRFRTPTPASVTADFTLNLHGVFEESLRATWLYAPEKQKTLSDMLGNIYSSGQLQNLKVINADNPFALLQVSGEFVFKNAWQGEGKPISYSFGITQMLGVFSDFIRMHKPAERKQPIEHDPGYTLSAQVQFSAPAGNYQSFLQSRGGNYQNPWFTLSQSVQEEKNTVQVKLDWVLNKQKINLVDYPKYYAAVQSVLDGAIWQVNFTPQETQAPKGSAATGQESQVLNSVHRLLDAGNFAEALREAQAATRKFPANGEAFYLLGLAQGYTDQGEAAQQSFNKARELGFVP
ncbi:MAG: hypothetical protein RL497_316 [Pseudomonadota bacterium]|jgi:transglutaminase-like putative cysteine protease/tetratricopeptide (TPR) repeat protein